MELSRTYNFIVLSQAAYDRQSVYNATKQRYDLMVWKEWLL